MMPIHVNALDPSKRFNVVSRKIYLTKNIYTKIGLHNNKVVSDKPRFHYLNPKKEQQSTVRGYLCKMLMKILLSNTPEFTIRLQRVDAI